MEASEPVELMESIRLGANALAGCLDPSCRHVPYWNCGFADGNVTQLTHAGEADHDHDVARALHALSMASEATGDPIDPEIIEHLADHEIALFSEDDELPGAPDNQTGRRKVLLHNVRENIHGLTALIKMGDRRAERWARRMIRKLLAKTTPGGPPSLEHLPPYVDGRTWQPHNGGRALDALARYYRVTNDEAAIDLAGRIAGYTLQHCFTEEGALTDDAGTHGHSITAVLAGLADLGLLIADAETLRRAKAIFDVGMPAFNSSFGWSMEGLGRDDLRGESNNTGDLLRAALLLGAAGWPAYYEAAERILRGHLLPSQVVDVEPFSNDPTAAEDCRRSIAPRVRGGFSFPTPNDYLVAPDAPIVTYDITSGAVDGLCEALRAAAIVGAAGARVNLLLNRNANGIHVRSQLPSAGRVEIENSTGRNVLVRIPSWVAADDVELSVDGNAAARTVIGGHLLVPCRQGRALVCFPVPGRRTVEVINQHEFTIDWRGDQIVAMSPAARHLPMFPPCGARTEEA